jgi:hypothetical protein
MKTMLIADENGRERHVGEDVDDFLEVEVVPTTDTIDDLANRVRQHIRRLASEDKSDDKTVTVVLDAAIHYRIMLEHLQMVMQREEKIMFFLAGS